MCLGLNYLDHVKEGPQKDNIFNEKGEYTGFDNANPLSRSGGKAEVIKRLDREPRSILIGDGVSDAEVRPRRIVRRLRRRRAPGRRTQRCACLPERREPGTPAGYGCRDGRRDHILADPQYRALAVKGLSS